MSQLWLVYPGALCDRPAAPSHQVLSCYAASRRQLLNVDDLLKYDPCQQKEGLERLLSSVVCHGTEDLRDVEDR